MKYLKKVLVIVLFPFLICSCNIKSHKAFKDNASNGVMNEICNAIEEKNKDKLSSLFSAVAKEESVSFYSDLENFFENFDDVNLLYGEHSGRNTQKERENGNEYERIITWYRVSGNREYIFFLIECTKDTANENNIGLYTLRIIEECDFEEQYIKHDLMEIPGIYYKPSRLNDIAHHTKDG